MKQALSFASLLMLCAAVPAQGFSVNYASPRGIEFFEGNSSSNIMLGNYSAMTRVQQIDNNLVGAKLPAIRFLGWRRNGAGGGVSGKTVTLTIVMAHSDFASVTSTWANNYKDAPKTVFTQKQVQLPDWGPARNNSAFDLYVPLDVPFVYNRQDALCWDVINSSHNSTQAMPQDWQSTTIAHTYGAYPTNLGGACASTKLSFVNETMFRANATTLEFGMQARQGPANAVAVALIGASDPNLSIPGFCGTLRVNPFLLLNLGTLDGNGELPIQALITTPWSQNLAGVPLHTQFLAVDPASSSTPLVFSNGVVAPAPTQGASGVAINVKRIYSTSPTSTTGTGPSNSACPTTYGI